MYYLNDEDNGDIFFTPEEFKEIFQFQPNNEKEYYVLRLYKVSTEEARRITPTAPRPRIDPHAHRPTDYRFSNYTNVRHGIFQVDPSRG